MREIEDEIVENKLESQERDDQMRKQIPFKSDEIDLLLPFKGKTRNNLKIYKIHLFYTISPCIIFPILRGKMIKWIFPTNLLNNNNNN